MQRIIKCFLIYTLQQILAIKNYNLVMFYFGYARGRDRFASAVTASARVTLSEGRITDEDLLAVNDHSFLFACDKICYASEQSVFKD